MRCDMLKRLLPALLVLLLVAGCVAVPPKEELAGVAGGSLIATSAAIGGGFGNSGCTLSSAGAISCNSNAIIGGTGLITGTTTLAGTTALNGIVTVGDGGDTVAINSSDWDIGATGDMTGIGSVTMDGALTVGTFANLTKAGVITVTNGSIITMTKTLQPLAAAGAVATASISGCATAGRLSILYNTVAQTITFTDTSTLMIAGNYGMTQYDTLTLIGDGTNCIELARAAN
jgi:hypothetical protein